MQSPPWEAAVSRTNFAAQAAAVRGSRPTAQHLLYGRMRDRITHGLPIEELVAHDEELGIGTLALHGMLKQAAKEATSQAGGGMFDSILKNAGIPGAEGI